jgi:hypothetical protein
VNDCKLNGVSSLNLGGCLETDLNDETTVSINYDYNDLSNGDLPKEVNVKWNHKDGGTSYGVDADLNLQDKSARADITVGTGDVSVTGSVDSQTKGYLTGAEATYNMNMGGKDCVLRPSWNCADNSGHLKVEADVNSDMKAELGMDLNADGDVTARVEYAINADNSIAPSFNLKDQSLTYEYTRRLADGSELTANVEPNKNVAIEWQDSAASGAWTTKMNVPWGNAGNSDISFKRSFDL